MLLRGVRARGEHAYHEEPEPSVVLLESPEVHAEHAAGGRMLPVCDEEG